MIEIKNLSKIFGKGKNETIALQNINLDINKGEIFGIIGISGAGKTTLLRCLSMLEKPTSGEIYLDGVAISGLKGQAKRQAHRNMGVVFQGYNLLMQKNVQDNVAFPLRLTSAGKKTAGAQVAKLLKLVDLSEKAGAYPSQLSGGQKQRVALARALATNPKVLLCDEPTSALDSLTTKSVLNLLKNINQTLGVTIIIITHEIAVVESICNRVAVINNSSIAEVGRVQDLISLPKTEIAKKLLGVCV